MTRLAGQTAIVTGGASGVGAAIAAAFVSEGANVVILDVFGDRAEEHAAKLDQGNGCAAGLGGDVRRGEDLAAAVELATQRFGRLDVMVNNAGVYDFSIPCADLDDDLWDRVIDINLKGTFLGTREALKVMIPVGAGSIVNIASSAGLGGARAGTAYTASKFGVVGLTKQTACENAAHGIRVNALAVGVTPTALAANSTTLLDAGDRPQPTPEELAALGAAAMAQIPLRRPADPAEIARTAVFLACSDSSYVTGHVLEVDGGWSAK